MNSPYLRRNSVTELELPQMQKDFDINEIITETEEETLDGTLRVDTSYAKSGFVIYYENLTKAEFDSLKTFLDTARNNGEMVEFKFEKVSLYESYIEVIARLSSVIPFVGGSGITDYYVSCELILKEVNPR